MKEPPWWAFIPGVNVIYGILKGIDIYKHNKEQDKEWEAELKEGKEFKNIVKNYANWARDAQKKGDYDQAQLWMNTAKAEITEYYLTHKDNIDYVFNKYKSNLDFLLEHQQIIGKDTIEDILSSKGINPNDYS